MSISTALGLGPVKKHEDIEWVDDRKSAKLSDYLTAINLTKANLIRNSVMPEAEEKAYPLWPIQKILAHHADAVLWVNELNCIGLPSYGLSNRQHFEFLLHILDARKRYEEYVKPLKDETVDLIKKVNKLSDRRARELVGLLSDDDIQLYQESVKEGGIENAPKRKKRGAVVNEPKTRRGGRRLKD